MKVPIARAQNSWSMTGSPLAIPHRVRQTLLEETCDCGVDLIGHFKLHEVS